MVELPIAGRDRALALLAGAAVLVPLLCTGCVSGSGDAVCARVFGFEGQMYTDAGDYPGSQGDLTFAVGAKIGQARAIDCDDESQHPQSFETGPAIDVYEVTGLDRSLGIAVGNSPTSVEFFAKAGPVEDRPAEITDFISASRTPG